MTNATGESLCLSCGLCCDGTLFDNVRLGEGEDAERLKKRGLLVAYSRAKAPVAFVRQPCPALGADRACCVYSDRPAQCRAFECRVFKDAQAGRMTSDAAQRVVARARRKAEQIRGLLRRLGDTEESLSLGKRFRRVERRMESGSADEAAAGDFAALGLALHQLDLLAHRSFYTTDEVS